MFYRLLNSGLVLLLSLVISSATTAETRFVGGTNNGLRTYAIVKRNGLEFRTDELGSRFNQLIWDELSTEDRRALLNVYGWQLGRRADHFGTTASNAMADWINQEQGWTAAAEALKARHADKNFPNLTPVFGPGTALLIPDYSCLDPEIVNSEIYKEAARLDVEIRADYAVGKQIYDMLVNAKWEQVSIAVKSLSEPLIKMIVDTFITGFVTNGASKVSELAVVAQDFVDDLKEFIADRQKAEKPQPTPLELIERLEKYIADMEATAETAVSLIQNKKNRLQQLADQIKAACAAKLQAKAEAAAAVRSGLDARTSAVPASAILPNFSGDIKAEAEAFYLTLEAEKAAITNTKSEKVHEVVTKYSPHLVTPYLPSEPGRYLAAASDQFSHPYFEITDLLTTVDLWLATDLPTAASKLLTSAGVLAYAETEVSGVLDATLPGINDLQAKALWLDQYAAILGYQPSVRLDFGPLRNFESLVDVAATTEKSVTDLIAELQATEKLVTEIREALGEGKNQRNQWIDGERARYDSLRFNFENSLSYVIATLTQLDQLHAGPYFQRSPNPYTCYGALCLYTYSVNVEAIKADIASQPTAAARETARVRAVQELLRLKAQEEALAQRLEIAQDAHLNDYQALDDFFSALYARYENASLDTILAEFNAGTGDPLKDPGDLAAALLPNLTYYFLGSNISNFNWIRSGETLRTNLGPALELVSGKIAEYYLLLDLYNRLAVNQGYYLGLGLADFNAFMTETTIKLETNGDYQRAFQMNNVWGIEYPAWQLVMKTNWRLESLNYEYRYGGQLPPVAWEIRGRVTSSGESGLSAASHLRPLHFSSPPLTAGGVGVPGVTVLIDGYLTASTTTESDGGFFFDFIGSGDFTLTAFGQGYQIIDSPKVLTIAQADVQTGFTAVPTAESGYFLAGRLAYGNGLGLKGVSLVLTSAAGAENVVFTGPDGFFNFVGVSGGTYTVKPVSTGLQFSPPNQTFTLPGSVFGVKFVAFDPLNPISGNTSYLPLILR